MKKKKKIINYKTTIILLIIFSLIILIFLFVNITKNKNNVKVSKLNFEHINDKEYAVFDVKNPTDEKKICSFTVETLISEFKLKNEIILPNSKKNIKILIDIPSGRSKIDLIYTCK